MLGKIHSLGNGGQRVVRNIHFVFSTDMVLFLLFCWNSVSSLSSLKKIVRLGRQCYHMEIISLALGICFLKLCIVRVLV